MTKSELIAELSAANPHLLSRDVETIVATIFTEITAALSRGERVELRGFGAFTVKHRDARTGQPSQVYEWFLTAGLSLSARAIWTSQVVG